MEAARVWPSFGAITRQTPREKRSVALRVATAGGSIGQFAIERRHCRRDDRQD